MGPKLLSWVLLWSCALAPSARAESVTWAFSGTVQSVDGTTPEVLDALSSLSIDLGEAIAGELRIDLDSPNLSVGNPFGYYADAIERQSLDVGGYHLDTEDLAASIVIVETPNPDGISYWEQRTSAEWFDAALALGPQGSLELHFATLDPTVFPDTTLRSTPPPSSLLSAASLVLLRGFTPLGDFTVVGSIEEVHAVPEPGLAGLARAGIALLGFARRRATS
jgi:hypothetical protein